MNSSGWDLKCKEMEVNGDVCREAKNGDEFPGINLVESREVKMSLLGAEMLMK